MSLENRKVVIAGGSGFLGVSLAKHLTDAGASVVILSRNPLKVEGPWIHHTWDGRTLGDWHRELDGASALVNYAGRSVDCLKTLDNCDEILRSRIESTRVLGEAVRAVSAPPALWAQMSTAHIYGDPPSAICDEGSPFGMGLAPTVGKAWEEEFRASLLDSQRGVVLRTSFVVGRDQGAGGGALDTLAFLARIGLAGRIGSGAQGMSWIHECDVNRIVERALIDEDMEGVYIASSPNPASQIEFMRHLRKAVGMPIGLPATAWMVRIGAPLIFRTDPKLALYGRYVMPKRLIDESFDFEFPELGHALKEILTKRKSANKS